MGKNKTFFERYEKKYIITSEQKNALLSELKNDIGEDEYSYSTVCNIYFDTPNFLLIRNSIEKPIYKEKLRLRCYNEPNESSTAFIELKKKYNGVVFKRRIALDYLSAYNYLVNNIIPDCKNEQIFKEIDYFKNYYENISPAMFLSYDRAALFLKSNPEIRLTFDTNITYRTNDLDLLKGVYGNRLINSDKYILEIKIPNAFPIELSRLFSKLNIYPSSYSKYGNAYIQTMKNSSDLTFCSSNNNLQNSKGVLVHG